MGSLFWLNQFSKLSLLYFIAYLCGLWVERKGIKVNYTRKINHFALFFLPHFIGKIIPFEPTTLTIFSGSLLSIMSLAIYLKPIRKRSSLLQKMFLSYDRPEDRPYTFLWLSTQFAATYAVYLPFYFYFRHQNLGELILIPILINGIGDGFAEPIGVRFGNHKYQTRALFTHKKFTRSYEGSACVFITSIVVLFFFKELFLPHQFKVALLAIPPLMTLAEAYSPHSWDSPFLFLIGGLTLAAIIL